ncbi:hypothetical protein BGZ61DRAFT_542441 [Ilyonectria robusta]|uniref:uncharacterized protein n=1 Tax=Ilyonectria robusta TaxID=1079257 RepID=UPI001E8E4527|nr:uncharacterized protein BGZ61DRAFT_542441 [Ilyonectria robusta]KAH8648231.1 hypothetical protein BGZ61DRAFT_542441 [Ilyonectria robusta]
MPLEAAPVELELSATSGSNQLVQILWGLLPPDERLFNGDPADKLCHSAYLEYYERQWGLAAAHCDGKFVALKTPESVNHLVRDLQNDKPRAELLAQIRDLSGTEALEEACENSLNLAVRLLLMLRIGDVKYQFLRRPCLEWNEASLRDFVHGRFVEEASMSPDGVKLPKSFNAWSLEAIGGIEISFTDNLADHLLLIEDDTSKVLIFPYASFLDCQRLKDSASLFPPTFAEETLRTLALLFPQPLVNGSGGVSVSRQSWFHQLCEKRSTRKIDKRLGRCGSLYAEDRQIQNFTYWRDRLVVLKQAYDEATPKTLSQFWHDRRNGVQWFTFWVAILVLLITVIFAVVQCIQGGFQAWKT